MVKKVVYTLLVLISILLGGGYLVLNILGDAFGAECNKTNSWNLEEYKVEKYRCLGWAGPPYYNAYLYKEGIQVSKNTISLNECCITFTLEDSTCLEFDLCRDTLIN